MEFILALLLAIAVGEVLAEWLVDVVRADFPWLITRKRDWMPVLDEKGLGKFLADGYDAELGWVRKPNTAHDEVGKYGKTRWSTDASGARSNPGFEGKPRRISCYGDSFTFCRQVNDSETWEHYLSGLTDSQVLNWGVGNHGVDQSYLRLKREYPRYPTPVVILGVVPDTISRIMSAWKHYYEYSNTFAFKPKFVLEDGALRLIGNSADRPEKFQALPQLMGSIQSQDYFFEAKFKKEIIHFPYLVTLLKNPRRNGVILFHMLAAKWGARDGGGAKRHREAAMAEIMRVNLAWRTRLYRQAAVCRLLVEIVRACASYAKEQGFHLVFTFLPQKDDILTIQRQGHFYQHVCDAIRQFTVCLDGAQWFLPRSDLNDLYSEASEYGAHINREGNRLIAENLYQQLKQLKLIPEPVRTEG